MVSVVGHDGVCGQCGSHVSMYIGHCQECGSFYRHTSSVNYFVTIAAILVAIAFIMSINGVSLLTIFSLLILSIITAIPASYMLNRIVRIFTKPKWQEPRWKKS